MKKTFIIISAFLTAAVSYGQDAQKAAAEAARTISDAPQLEVKVEKPKYWTESLKTNISVGQTSLTNWAAGGDNTVSFAAYIDGNANYKKNDMFWNNRLQLDYGFLYASSKPILQKSTDRIYLESKWGYKSANMNKWYFSLNYDFKSQFARGWTYNTPKVTDEYADAEGNLPALDDLGHSDQVQLWKGARTLKSGFLAPAYTNLALGIDYKPAKWLSINVAPLTGGFVIVRLPELRNSYSMGLKKDIEEYAGSITDEFKSAYDAAVAAGTGLTPEQEKYRNYLADYESGAAYRAAKFEFGAQFKADVAVNVNDNFKYTSQVVLFANYLDIKHCPRINWDNRFDWKIAKYFSLTLTTNLIYDDKIMIADKEGNNPKARVQFKESLAFGFTYTIASK